MCGSGEGGGRKGSGRQGGGGQRGVGHFGAGIILSTSCSLVLSCFRSMSEVKN